MTDDERQAINSFREISRAAPDVADALMRFPWLADGVTEYEMYALYNLREILREDASFTETLIGFPWIADGVTGDESHTIYNLREISRDAPATAETLLSFTWLADGVTEDEFLAVSHLQVILKENLATAEALLSFPWLADGVTEDESHAVYNLREILLENSTAAEALLSLPWLADGVTEDESSAVYNFRKISRKDNAMASMLLGSPWFSDGVSRNERRTLRGLRNLYDLDRSRLSALTSKHWFKDGLSDEEFMLLGDLGNIAYTSETDALALIGMPFLETFEPADALAVASLRHLTWCDDGQFKYSMECSDGGSGYQRVSKKFRQAMAHPHISDGISDEEATIVATLHAASSFSTDIFDSLLDPDTVTLEERTINLPHTGETQLTIIRIRPGAERTMDLLESAVRTVEGFMGTPFPLRHYIFLAENTNPDGVTIDLTGMSGEHEWFDSDERPEVDALHVFAHETAHLYWYYDWSLHWVAEGMATFFQSLARWQVNVGPGVPVVPIWPSHMPPCPITSNIAELERLDRNESIKTYCSDSLGERMAQDLWRSLGDSVFRQGLANLYLTSRSGAPVAGCEHVRKAGMCQLAAAFKAAAPADAAETVDKVLGRWFYNSEPYDISHVDTSPPNPSLPNGVEITRAYISLDEDRPEATMTDSFSASEVQERVFLSLHFFTPTVRQERELPLTVVEYFEDGFAYRVKNRTYTLRAGRPQGSRSYLVGSWWSGPEWISVGNLKLPPTWATGRHWVSVYHGEQKVAEVEFEVTP